LSENRVTLFGKRSRRAIPSDLPEIVKLYHCVWHETHAPLMPAEEGARRTPAFLAERMVALLPYTLVLEKDGAMAGFSAWSGRLIGQVYVAARYRGSGVGAALMAATERAMAGEGIAEAELCCILGNDRALRFYERMGWRHDGIGRTGVAGPDGETEIGFWRMRKRLAP
jgi:GNAT superfamily N-acetyltransferase